MSNETERASVYAGLADAARAQTQDHDRLARMQIVSDLVWEHLGSETRPGIAHAPGRPYSWVGFYTLDDGSESMTLAARRDKPACSPIEMHGMCGKGALEAVAILIDDVRTLGESYVACDPNDQSELVVPCYDENGSVWGVYDGDSFDLGAFTEADAAGVLDLLDAAGLSPKKFAKAGTLKL